MAVQLKKRKRDRVQRRSICPNTACECCSSDTEHEHCGADMRSLASAGAGVSSKKIPEDSAPLGTPKNRETGEGPGSFAPRVSPTSFVSHGEHICGSLFAKCRQHNRQQLLETFTNPNSFLSQQTFTERHRLQKSDAYAELFRGSKQGADLGERENRDGRVPPEETRNSEATKNENGAETSGGPTRTSNGLGCGDDIFARNKPQARATQSSQVRCRTSLAGGKPEVHSAREIHSHAAGGRITLFSGSELTRKDMVGKHRSQSDRNVNYTAGSGDGQERTDGRQETGKMRSFSDTGRMSTAAEDVCLRDVNGPKRRNQTTQTGTDGRGNSPCSRGRDETKFDAEAITRRYYADSDCFRFALLEMKKENKEWVRKVDFLETEIMILQRELKKRDQENSALQMEVNKLRSVLEQNNVYKQKDILSSLHDSYGMSGQVQQTIAVANSSKKQGVSGESSDNGRKLNQIEIERFHKDFRSKQLIKDAILENDYLKNLDSSQVREIVDSVYPKEFEKGSYVIKEGETGSHLYVSAEGDFEVIKEGKTLGRMGPGRAFGELAILYNCRRTASIRVAIDSKVWVLDRRVFQQIMMKTGLQRLEENVRFLKSVPLLQSLTDDVLAKIADVLEVEFYPSGEHIIRQGGSGDTFFIISSGQVKVTQHKPNRQEEEIRILGKGDYFGEQALLREDWRTANVIALSPGVECLTLDRDSFIQLIGDLSELQEKNYEDLENRSSTKPSISVSLSGSEEYGYIQLKDLEVINTLGIGGFGRVELVQYNNNKDMTFALKCLKKKHIVDTQQQEHIYSERNNMMACKSPFLCRLYRTFRDSKYVYMLLEACLGGEVWNILRERGCFDDYTSRFVSGCVIEGFEYLHARGIIYRDLKPENLMLDNSGYVKIVDFGFSKRLAFSSKTWTFCGTPEYVAPEIILNKGHDRAVDYWSLGILIHELLTGQPPFTAPDPMRTYNIILKGIDMIDFPKHVSRAAQSLIKRLCRDSPSERLGYQRGGIEDIKKHKWYQGFDWQGLKQRTLSPPIKPVVRGPTDTSNFDTYPADNDPTPDEFSNWDAEF